MENGYLMSKKYKIVVTGGTGRFGKKLKEFPNQFVILMQTTVLDLLQLTLELNKLLKMQKKQE